MGIYVKAILLPFEVTDEQWANTYTEALKLIDAYDFLDKIEDRERFSKLNLAWHYCIKSREREIDGQIGVAISGALNGCIRAEENTLYKNLDNYKLSRKGFFGDIHTATKPEGKLCNDALFDVCPENDWLSEYQDYGKMVFWSKTQGYDHHNYLLAVALLFEDRLGKTFTVYGDITRGQIKAAIEWANQHLDTPIMMPARMDNAQLFTRLSAFVPREHLLNAFMNLIYSPKNEEINEFINKHFTHEEIMTYWAGEISHCSPGTIGSSRFFLRYFDMSSDLELLTRICIPKFTLQEYVKEMASIKVFEAEKNTDNPIASDPDRETPEPIEVVMGKMMAMGLSNNVTKRYISLEQGITKLNDAF